MGGNLSNNWFVSSICAFIYNIFSTAFFVLKNHSEDSDMILLIGFHTAILMWVAYFSYWLERLSKEQFILLSLSKQSELAWINYLNSSP
jgi:hypothetical protein